VLLNCDEFHKGSDNSINIAGMCNASIDKMMATAETEELTNQTASNAMWGKIDKLIMTTQAPWVPLFNPKLIDFVSKRVGNYQFSLEFYMYVDQLWVK
jgi:peptide/nickel transport system substrate-binding protein